MCLLSRKLLALAAAIYTYLHCTLHESVLLCRVDIPSGRIKHDVKLRCMMPDKVKGEFIAQTAAVETLAEPRQVHTHPSTQCRLFRFP